MKTSYFRLLVLCAVFLFCLVPAQSQDIKKPLRIGVASMITPVDTVKYYQDLIDYVSKKMGMPVEMVHRRTYDEMDRMLEKGEVDAAFICSAPYVKDKREFGVELLVAPMVNSKVFYNSYIIVHKDSNIKAFWDLKDKTFAFTDPKSNSGKLYPEFLLAKEGLRPQEFFSKYIYSYSHNKSIELVAKKVVDGAAVESPVYEFLKKAGSPFISQTKIIHISDEFGIPPVVMPPGVPTYEKEKLREILEQMHKDSEGKKILDAMLIEKFVDVPDSNYDSIREMESFRSQFRGAGNAEEKKANTIYFGVIPRDNPRIAYEKYQPLLDYLSDNTSYNYELVLKKSYEETVNALGEGEIDIALLGPLTYLEAHAGYGAICILKGVTLQGKAYEQSIIITRKGNRIEKLSDLKGKSFAFASVKSTSGNLIPRYMLADSGIHLRELGTYKNFDYFDSVMKWVLSGKFDAGAVRNGVKEKYSPLGIKVLAVSDPVPTSPVVIGPKTSYVYAAKTKSQLMQMSKTEKGRAVLKKLDSGLRGGFIEAQDEDYAIIRKMINDVPKTCGIGCHPKIKL
jgi:phosphonate transport system substrate-binding protein